MPIYEYRCERGHLFDAIQRMVEEPLTSCTTCSAPVQRVFHAPAVHFKGSGFYSTDYGRAGSSNNADKGTSENGSSSEASSGDGSKESEKKTGAAEKNGKASAPTSSASAEKTSG